MTDEPPKRERELFEGALELPTEERSGFLRDACQDNAELERRILDLLDAHQRDTELEAGPRPSMDEPQQIGPYRILEPIGEGGMGIIYLAEQTRPVRRRVALKIIKLGMDTKEVIARFESERQALAMMNHPNIARILDAGATESGRPYFVMEHVPGIAIVEYCDSKHWSVAQRLGLFHEICEAVQHAHQKGVIHRDLKPSNILVKDQDGRPTPKVIDFGIAKATGQRLSDLTVHTKLGSFVGTPEYISPEQAEMSALDVDTRADVYSLGAVLYELLAGTPPFRFSRETGIAEIQRVLLEKDPVPPSIRVSSDSDSARAYAKRRRTTPEALSRQLHGDLDWIVLKTLEKDRARRYSSASELAADLHRHLAQEPVTAGPPSAIYRMGKFARRNRLAIALVGAIVFGIVGAAAGLTYALIQANQRRAEVEAALRDSDAVTAFLSDMLAAVDPAAEGTDVTVRQVLDEAAQRIDAQLEAQPLVAARLRTTIGVTYRALGEFEPAEGHLRTALEIRQRLLGDTAPATLDSQSEIAWLDHMRGQYSDAETALVELVDARRRLLGEEHPATLASINGLASNYIMQERTEEAIPLLESAMEVMTRTLGEEHRIYLAAIAKLALAYQVQGRYEDAEPLLLEAFEFDRRRYGETHVDTLASMQNLASLYRQLGRYSASEPLYATSVENARIVFGAEHPTTLRYMGNLALLYSEMQRFAEAEQLSRQVLEARRRVLGEENPSTLVTSLNLALLYNRMERYEEGASLAKRTREIASRVMGADHFYAIAAEGALGVAQLGEGRAAQAEALLAKVVQRMEQNFSARHWRVGAALTQHGSALTALERFSEAEAELLEAHEILTESFDPEHRLVQEVVRRIAALYAAWGRPEKAAHYRNLLSAIEDGVATPEQR